MLEGFLPEKSNCKTPIDDIAEVAAKLHINGTPAIISGDGRLLSGAPRTAESLINWIRNK